MATQSKENKGFYLYKRLLTYALPYWPVFVVAVIAMTILATTDALFAHLFGHLIDENLVAKNKDLTANAPLLIVFVFFIRGFTSFISGSCMAWIGRMTIFKIRNEMFEHMLTLPSAYLDQNSSGQLISKFTFNTEQIAQALTSAVTILVRDSLIIVFLFSTLFYLQGAVTFLFLLVGPIVAYLLYKLSTRFRKISKRIQSSMGDITTAVQETIENDKLIKLHGGAAQQRKKFFKTNKKNKQQQLKMLVTAIASAPFIQFLVGIIVALIMYVLIEKGISAGEFVTYISALLAIMPPLKRLTTVNSAIQKGIAAADSIFEFIDSAAEKDTGDKKITRVDGNIEFQQVSFSYHASQADQEDKKILKNINLEIRAGEKIALIGKSGGGKSTLVNLLPRFYEIGQGQITLDGINIREFQLSNLRSQFSLVSQSITLFEDTIANNIAYGALAGIDRKKIEAAAEIAHATEFIEKWSDGFDTLIGEGGIQLSGGQKQRIAIARAILKDAPILILDEATSALDSESEKFVQEGIEKLSRGRTTLVIAHRLATVESADKIIVIENGQIAEMGSHSTLLEKNGYYARYYKNQFSD